MKFDFSLLYEIILFLLNLQFCKFIHLHLFNHSLILYKILSLILIKLYYFKNFLIDLLNFLIYIFILMKINFRIII